MTVLKSNGVQFAVVREDPEIELSALIHSGATKFLGIASGGCTGFAMRARFPQMQITMIDPNPAQVALVKEKAHLLASRSKDFDQKMNIATDAECGLNQNGNFESLFRSLRLFINEFIITQKDLESHFLNGTLSEITPTLFKHKYWPIAFELFFSDAILLTMFGPDAVQHATPGSYPGYFKKVFERGLEQEDAATNYFLHHILLGKYLPGCLPSYLTENTDKYSFAVINGYFEAVQNLGEYDFIDFSNIFDWMPEREIIKLASRCNQELDVNAVVLFRQLNNDRDLQKHFSGFVFDDHLAEQWRSKDRSLFYNKINYGKKNVR